MINNDFIAEFLEDYFVECDEHLGAIRNHLLQLEPLIQQPNPDLSIINQLFRSFHTIKGLSAMVGVQEAEELSHQIENYLRLLRDDGIPLSELGFSALMNGAKLLEQIITAQRNQTPLPSITTVIEQLAPLIPTPEKVSHLTPVNLKLNTEQNENLTQLQQQGKIISLCTFTPSKDLAASGINVNHIRAGLEKIGQLIYTAPRLIANKDIVFDFILATDEPIESLNDWEKEGVSIVPYQPILEKIEVKEPSHLLLEEDFNSQVFPIDIPTIDQIEKEAAVIPGGNIAPVPLITQTSTVVRVDLPKLDDLMRMVGELVISRTKLEDLLLSAVQEEQLTISDSRKKTVKKDARVAIALKEINLTFERQLRSLREGVMRVRLVPIADAFARMQFVVRDLLRDSEKQITLNIIGQDTEIDKLVVERMMDPLLHLVRNAVSHGIETPAEREQQGKSPQGTITLNAKTKGEIIEITIADDGRGLDISKIIQQAKLKRLIPEDSQIKDDFNTILDIITMPGFSTKEQADLTSGRGVGMAIVKSTVLELGGMLSLYTQLGQGTRYTIELPLTIAIADALLISVAGQTFAIPQTAVREVKDIKPAEVITIENDQIIPYRTGVLPLIHLDQQFNLETTKTATSLYKTVIAGSEQNPVGLIVDSIKGLREIVVRPLIDPLIQVLGFAGATESSDGKVILIIDVAALIKQQKLGDNLANSYQKQPLFKPMSQPITTTQPFILFHLNETTYGIPSQQVQQMEMIETITPVPNAPKHVEGVIFSRGQVIPVINLRSLFKLEKIPYSLSTRLIVISINERTIGLIVDDAREFLIINADNIQLPPEEMTGESCQYLAGIATLEKRIILILNPETLIVNSE